MNKALQNETVDRHLFIVRLWREESQATAGGQWRGSVEHVPSGQRIHFISLDALTAFIGKQLDVDSPNGTDQVSGEPP